MYLQSVTSLTDAIAKLAGDLIGHARKDAPTRFNDRLATL
jgi:hypothetical protein